VVFEQAVRLFQLLLEFGAALVGDFAQHAHRALELAGGHFVEVDVVLLEQAVQVGHLGHHADAADDGKRRGDDLVRHAGHHVATARRHAVDAHGELELALLQAGELGGGEAVVRHCSAG
jgi:hypothetical protein